MGAVLDQFLDEQLLKCQHPGRAVMTADNWDSVTRALQLSTREIEVCKHLFEGQTREQIATQLDIKLRTVRHHMEHLHDKLKVTGRIGLVLRIVQVRDELEIRAQRTPVGSRG